MADQSQPPVWFITGSSSGLGLALTRYAMAQGHTVIASSRNPPRTPELVDQVEKSGGKWITFDATQSDKDIKATVQHAESFFNRIDILVNNAGISVVGALEDIPDEDTVYQMRVNFLGPLRVMQAVLPGMRRRRSGVIMNVSSAQGVAPGLACGVYAASKAALEAASESCSQEVAQFGIRILIIVPGAYRTDFATSSSGKHVSPSEEYAGDHQVNTRLKALTKLPSIAMGSPDKAAEVMFEAATGLGETGELVKRENLLRVIIGPDCWKSVDRKVTELRRTMDLLEDVAASTNL
jgi:NAD(P)-dependent dehydrogenase (short-subunit alcohol dehydrogenase family)